MQDKSAYRKKGETPTQALLTCRREALSLYREILRISALFDWPNEQGVLWYVGDHVVWVYSTKMFSRFVDSIHTVTIPQPLVSCMTPNFCHHVVQARCSQSKC